MERLALLLVDHGSRSADANATLDQVAALVRQLRPNLLVHIAHMDLAKPTIAEGFERCVQDGATQIIVHPYMLSPGRHAMADIPRIVAEAAAGHAGVRYALTPPLGCHVKMAEVVLERAGLA